MEQEYKSWSLDRWVKFFDEIYGERNRGMMNEEIWLHVVEEVAELTEDLRKTHIKPRYNKKGELEGVLVNFADIFAWLCAFVTRHGSLEEIVWHKFPNICPYCFADKDCLCIARMSYMDKEEREKYLETHRKNKNNFPQKLDDWKKMFDRIYGNINRVQSIEQIGFHMTEEVGEVAREIRLRRKEELKEEIADVFAWLIAIILKCEAITNEEFNLADLLWQRFPNKCHRCGSKPCKEKIYRTGPRANIS
ncbi:MAG: MazG nucleotide pyrophosphohydrolase domain-containing protein [Thermoproteota archaeon]